MDETVYQIGELLISVAAAGIVIGAVLLLLGKTDAGILRIYVETMLKSAC